MSLIASPVRCCRLAGLHSACVPRSLPSARICIIKLMLRLPNAKSSRRVLYERAKHCAKPRPIARPRVRCVPAPWRWFAAVPFALNISLARFSFRTKHTRTHSLALQRIKDEMTTFSNKVRTEQEELRKKDGKRLEEYLRKEEATRKSETVVRASLGVRPICNLSTVLAALPALSLSLSFLVRAYFDTRCCSTMWKKSTRCSRKRRRNAPSSRLS